MVLAQGSDILHSTAGLKTKSPKATPRPSPTSASPADAGEPMPQQAVVFLDPRPLGDVSPALRSVRPLRCCHAGARQTHQRRLSRRERHGAARGRGREVGRRQRRDFRRVADPGRIPARIVEPIDICRPRRNAADACVLRQGGRRKKDAECDGEERSATPALCSRQISVSCVCHGGRC